MSDIGKSFEWLHRVSSYYPVSRETDPHCRHSSDCCKWHDHVESRMEEQTDVDRIWTDLLGKDDSSRGKSPRAIATRNGGAGGGRHSLRRCRWACSRRLGVANRRS